MTGRERLDPAQRRRVEALFERALELPPGERAAWLRLAAPDRLRGEVLALLAAHDRSTGILEEDAAAAGREILAASGPPSPRRVGPYRLEAEIGRGGMGIVYRAARADGQFDRQVAVKILMAPAYSLDLHRRFLVERQILASLDHPNIARLLDGGVTEEGNPYLVMELIDGRPITDFAAEKGLSVPERLRLLLRVCAAVEYAHGKLVVHRDLKPSNVLVTGEGQPKLLDFGIAKLLDEKVVLGVSLPETRTGWLPMTPEYASPEQLTGETLGTATDVYSLGVVLFELLTGRRPFDLRGLSPAEAERAVRECEPPRPSAAASLPDGVSRRQVRGDLDRIALHALRKEPRRRYGSAAQLADDIGRHLSGHPVRARGDSAGYRLCKFVARHRWTAATAVALLFALAGGLAATAWQARLATRQAARATAERDRAELEAQKAARVSSLLSGLLRLSDPTRRSGDTVTARELLDEGSERIDRELVDEPELQAELLSDVADIYANLGLLERAESVARRALSIRERRLGPGAPETAESLARLGRLLVSRGRGREAIPLYRMAIAVRESAATPRDTLLAAWRSELAWQLRSADEDEEAARLFRAALEVQQATLGLGRPELARTVLGLASVYHDGGRTAEAESLFVRAAGQNADGSGPPDPAVATALLAAGSLRHLREDFAGAERLLAAARSMRAALYEPDHPDRIEADKEWASLLYTLGRYAEAGLVARDGLERAVRVLGSDHPHAGTLREILALVLTETGRYGEAIAHYDTILADKRGRYGDRHAEVTAALQRSAEPLLLAGRTDEARARWLDVLQRAGGESATGAYAARALDGLGRAAQDEGRPEKALALLVRAESTAAEALRPGHRWVAGIRRDRAAVLVDLGRAGEAIPLAETALRADLARYGEPHSVVGADLGVLGRAQVAAGRPRQGEGTLRRALSNLAELPSPHWQIGELRTALGETLRERGREAAGRRLKEEGLSEIRAHVGTSSPRARRLSGLPALPRVEG